MYDTVEKYDIICISETFLDSSPNKSSLLIPGYHLLRADHPKNLKKGGVCLYFKENLSLRQIETAYFFQFILSELTIQNKVGYIVVIYCSLRKFDIHTQVETLNVNMTFGGGGEMGVGGVLTLTLELWQNDIFLILM